MTPRKRPAWRITATDGLDAIVKIGPPPFSRKDIPENLFPPHHRLDEKQFWRAINAGLADDPAEPVPFSLEWYARKIAPKLDRLNAFKKTHPEHAWAVEHALLAGFEMAFAWWKLNRGRDTRSGKQQRAKAPRAGKLSGKTRKQQQTVRRHQISAEARRLRAAHPTQDKLSTRQLAIRISAARNLKFETVYKDLKALKIE